MLKQRVLTALILLPLALLAIFALPAPWLMVLLGAILLGGTWEYTRLAGFTGGKGSYFLVLLQTVILISLFVYRPHWDAGILTYLYIACAVWLLMFLRLPLFRPGVRSDNAYRFISSFTAIASVTTGWFALCWIRAQADGSWLLLLFLLIVWAADTGAYFAGKNFGKTKLAPQISPGKTRVGLFGGLIAAPLIALLASRLMPIAEIDTNKLILISLIVTLASVGGDLLISLQKRASGYKDSGSLLPGHGGILDRVDSLLGGAPFFALGLLVTGI